MLSGIYLKGIVDRLDTCEQNNSFRIIDYKTGSDKFSFKDVYFGMKIQLIIYLKAIQNLTSMQPASAMYMPVNNDFTTMVKTEFGTYKLDGIILNNKGVIYNTDKQIVDNNTSDIINVSYTQKGELSANSLKNAVSVEELNSIMEYACNILNKAVDEMLEGYIEPKPYLNSQKNSCNYCKYKSLCHFDIVRNGHRNTNIKKNKASFS